MSDVEFVGQDCSPERCDQIMHTLSKSKGLIDSEVTLFQYKWFDYRFENPVVSTYRFTEAYRRAYKVLYARHFDKNRAEHVGAFKATMVDPFDFSSPTGERTGLWRARQTADCLGIPYDFYCLTSMELALGRVKRNYLPRPTHLYNFDLVTAINEAWENEIAGIVHVAEDARFSLDAYQGTHAQDDYHEWLMKLIALRSNVYGLLKRFVFVDRLLPFEKAVARFGIEKVTYADEM